MTIPKRNTTINVKTHLLFSDEAIALGAATSIQAYHLLPMVLWQYGLWMDATVVGS